MTSPISIRSADAPPSMSGSAGRSAIWTNLFKELELARGVDCPVLLIGEPGSGKRRVARTFHRNYCSTDAPFVEVDCRVTDRGSIPDEETGTNRISGFVSNEPTEGPRRWALGSSPRAWVEEAQGGTLYIDEIGGLPSHDQVELIEALQNSPHRPRLISASTAPAATLQSQVREDFYYRISVVTCAVPALRARQEDIALLSREFLDEACRRSGRKRVKSISAAARRLLETYSWPGNLSELRSAIEHAAVKAGDRLEPHDLPSHVRSVGTDNVETPIHLPPEGLRLKETLEAIENQLLLEALERTGWNKQKAATMLGMNRTTLVEMLKRKRMARSGT